MKFLKVWPEYFEAIVTGVKTFEIRLNDRDFQVGDTLMLKEFDPNIEEYTGRVITKTVNYILDKQPFVPDGYVCMSIS